MVEFLMRIAFVSTISIGSSVLMYLAVNLVWKTIDKILGLLKFSKVLIQYSKYKGKCKECRRNDVYTPRISEEERREIKRRLTKKQPR